MNQVIHESTSKYISDKSQLITDSKIYNYFVELDNNNFEHFLQNLNWLNQIKLRNFKKKYSDNFLLYSQKRTYIKLRKIYDKKRKKIFKHKNNNYFYYIKPNGNLNVYQLEKDEVTDILNKNI